jgi:hypothetical protein
MCAFIRGFLSFNNPSDATTWAANVGGRSEFVFLYTPFASGSRTKVTLTVNGQAGQSLFVYSVGMTKPPCLHFLIELSYLHICIDELSAHDTALDFLCIGGVNSRTDSVVNAVHLHPFAYVASAGLKRSTTHCTVHC